MKCTNELSNKTGLSIAASLLAAGLLLEGCGSSNSSQTVDQQTNRTTAGAKSDSDKNTANRTVIKTNANTRVIFFPDGSVEIDNTAAQGQTSKGLYPTYLECIGTLLLTNGEADGYGGTSVVNSNSMCTDKTLTPADFGLKQP